MGAIKDMVDLIKDLESRLKDRKDVEAIHQIQSLAFSLQSQHVEIVEQNLALVQENTELKRQLAESQSEEIRIRDAIEFRRGKRTGGEWVPFCPKCHMPARVSHAEGRIFCSATCGWVSDLPAANLRSVVQQLDSLRVKTERS